MTLFEVLKVYSHYGTVHIATENGKWWLYSGYNAYLPSKMLKMGNRQVTSIYQHDGREETNTCKAMDPGLAIIIEGNENGTI